jgi:hypothetical protein
LTISHEKRGSLLRIFPPSIFEFCLLFLNIAINIIFDSHHHLTYVVKNWLDQIICCATGGLIIFILGFDFKLSGRFKNMMLFL